MNKPQKLFDAEALPPQMTPETRIIRMASRALEVQALLSPQRTVEALNSAASGHFQAALRCHSQAESEPELRVKLSHLEEAGHHAGAALVAMLEADRRS